MTASDQNRIDAAAGDWLVRLSEGPLSTRERALFDAWRQEDPRHARSFAELAQTWDDIGTLQHLSASTAVPRPDPRRRTMRPGRRAGLAAAATALAASLLALVTLPNSWLLPDQRLSTDIAEIRTITLSDGSRLTLGADSKAAVDFSDKARHVRLSSGEAFFDVASDPRRPFFVEAGAVKIRVVGTKFDVNRSAAGVRVAVLEGKVRVEAEPEEGVQPIVRLLTAGQRAVARPAAAKAAQPQAAPPEPALAVATFGRSPIAAWRDGRLVYDNAPLSDLVADVNRYYAPGVTLAEGAGNLRVTASFRTDEITAFMNTLDDALPVTVARDAGDRFLIGRRASEG